VDGWVKPGHDSMEKIASHRDGLPGLLGKKRAPALARDTPRGPRIERRRALKNSSGGGDQLITVTPRRFCAQAASFEPTTAGRSLP
jgi:hypothetical protein